MTRRLPWILFAVSLLLNLFFAGGVVYSKLTAERLEEDPKARLAFAVEELGLSEAEQQRLLALRRSVSKRRGQMRGEGESVRQALGEELRRPKLDEDRVEQLLGQRSQLFVAYLSDVMGALHGFLAGLPPEKREEFLGLMEKERRFMFRLMREPRGEGSSSNTGGP